MWEVSSTETNAATPAIDFVKRNDDERANRGGELRTAKRTPPIFA